MRNDTRPGHVTQGAAATQRQRLRFIAACGALTLVAAAGIVAAQPGASAPANPLGPAPAATREIALLLEHIERSGCQFERNGEWHDAPAARAHIDRKYRTLAERGKVPSAEAFIELAASSSSTTGRPYMVRCGQAAAVPSGPWLRQALARLRAPQGQR
jgi:hypothetical protein